MMLSVMIYSVKAFENLDSQIALSWLGLHVKEVQAF